ncbi:hypothetical protein EVA_08454 [gut metagenome]|uniref:Uncharacterized protein n=1 Tax=gut metagenome TaxID=749906 RepID=J9GT17_9ZZZZ
MVVKQGCFTIFLLWREYGPNRSCLHGQGKEEEGWDGYKKRGYIVRMNYDTASLRSYWMLKSTQ